MLLMFSMISWTLSLILIFMKHPLSLGMILLIQTMIVSMMTGLLNLNFWFSYILFLIMIGGMLILFIYMTSIASNEKFSFPKKLFLLMMFMAMSTGLLLFLDAFFMYFDSMNYDLASQELSAMDFSMNNFFSMPNLQVLILLMIYLLLTLIIAAKITKNKMGPMRSKS